MNEPLKHLLAEIASPLHLGFAALLIAKDKFSTEYLSPDEIIGCLVNAGVALHRKQLVNALNRAGNRISPRDFDGVTKYRLMISGRREVEPLLQGGNVSLSYIEGGRPRTARRLLGEILGDLDGIVRVSDPYYGVRSLDSLELMPLKCEVRFLTGTLGGGENPRVIAGAIGDFKRERPNTHLRVASSPSDLHDRYIATSSRILILGHGLKDIGNKESFVIILDKDIAPDLHNQLVITFDTRWGTASAL